MSDKKTTNEKPGSRGHAPSPIPGTTNGNVGGSGGGLTWPANNAVENANAARGQAVIDAYKNAGNVDTARPPHGPFPPAK